MDKQCRSVERLPVREHCLANGSFCTFNPLATALDLRLEHARIDPKCHQRIVGAQNVQFSGQWDNRGYSRISIQIDDLSDRRLLVAESQDSAVQVIEGLSLFLAPAK